jgi:hypothetical protein
MADAVNFYNQAVDYRRIPTILYQIPVIWSGSCQNGWIVAIWPNLAKTLPFLAEFGQMAGIQPL